MHLFNLVAVVITLSALFGYVNHRTIGLPTTIGVMLISIIVSLGLVVLAKMGTFGLGFEQQWVDIVKNIDFNKTMLVGMLGFLLFAGALHIELNELMKLKWEVAIFATVGVALSTVLVGTLSYIGLSLLDLNIPLMDCMMFGALISPTDPVSVLGIVREAGLPKSMETRITGESLFNDGVGVVVFTVMLGIVSGGGKVTAGEVSLLLAKEAVGGVVLGLVLGWSAYAILKSIDNYTVEILVTLSLVTGGFSLASLLGTSGPITIVVAGLLIGSRGREFAMSEKTRRNLDTFWQVIDEILNAVLFVLIGIELIVVTLKVEYLIAGLISIPVVLLARLISIGAPACLLSLRKKFSTRLLKIMTWGGLRGGISVALALSLPVGTERDIFITMTYTVVVFSILFQGLTIKRIFKPDVEPDSDKVMEGRSV